MGARSHLLRHRMTTKSMYGRGREWCTYARAVLPRDAARIISWVHAPVTYKDVIAYLLLSDGCDASELVEILKLISSYLLFGSEPPF